jgi:hypothetical protein
LDNFGAPSPLEVKAVACDCQVTAARLNADYLTGPSEQANQVCFILFRARQSPKANPVLDCAKHAEHPDTAEGIRLCSHCGNINCNMLRPLQLHMLHHLQLSFETSLLMAAASSNWNGYWQIPHAEKVPSAMDIPKLRRLALCAVQ